MTQRYLVGNPFAALPAKRTGAGQRLGAGRSLSTAQWAFVLQRLETEATTVGHARMRFALPWLYATAALLHNSPAGALIRARTW